MAIEALLDQPRMDIPAPNVSDDIGANVEALRLSGLVTDENREAVEQQVGEDFGRLGELGVAGELLVAVSHAQLPLSHRVAVLDGLTQAKHGEKHPKTYVYESLWVPGRQTGSYSDDVLNKLGPEYDDKQWVAHGRLIIPSSESSPEPILHHLNKPFDGRYAQEGEETQLEALAAQKAVFEAEHPTVNLNPLTARDVALLAVVRLVKGESMPMEWGFMRDGTLPRTTVGGDSFVGSVFSRGGQLGLAGSLGRVFSDDGVGVSAGHSEA